MVLSHLFLLFANFPMTALVFGSTRRIMPSSHRFLYGFFGGYLQHIWQLYTSLVRDNFCFWFFEHGFSGLWFHYWRLLQLFLRLQSMFARRCAKGKTCMWCNSCSVASRDRRHRSSKWRGNRPGWYVRRLWLCVCGSSVPSWTTVVVSGPLCGPPSIVIFAASRQSWHSLWR